MTLVLVTVIGIYIAARPSGKTVATHPSIPSTPPPPPATPPTSLPAGPQEADAPSTPEPTSKQPKAKKGARLTIKAGQPIPELFPFQAERDRLHGLGSTYDPRNIPTIAPSLKHEDATVRDAARHALVQIGDAAAIPYLKAAAAAAKTPEEAETLNESAEFLSLPSFMDVITANNAGVTPSP